jgi:hypothetical protein
MIIPLYCSTSITLFQFVCVTGVVVAFDDYERLWIFTYRCHMSQAGEGEGERHNQHFSLRAPDSTKCIEIIPDTNAELRFRTQCTQLFADVLSKAWTLSAEEQERLLKETESKVEDNKKKAARLVERLAKKQRREKRHTEKIAKAYRP